MTLPKNITRLVDDYRQAVEEDYSDGFGGTPSPGTVAVRAALEAAIAAAIQPVERGEFERQASAWLDFAHTTMPAFDSPEFRGAYLRLLWSAAELFLLKVKPVEPPTDAEVEAWEKQAKRVLHWPDENRDHPDAVFVVSIRTLADGLALMRRARATGSWNGGPTITALMRGVEDAAIEWGKCCGDYHAACQAAPPPSGLQATDAVREAGHRCELTYGYFQKAIKALADHGTQTGSLERLRERVQDALHSQSPTTDELCGKETAYEEVLRWIDEERGAGR